MFFSLQVRFENDVTKKYMQSEIKGKSEVKFEVGKILPYKLRETSMDWLK